MAPPSTSPYTHQGSPPQSPILTRPLRLGRPPTEEATELTELMEELLGLWVSADTPMAIRLVFLALAGLVDGKPMRITLWMGPQLSRMVMSGWSRTCQPLRTSREQQGP